MCSGEKVRNVAGQLFASAGEIKHVTHISLQPSQQKIGIEMDYTGKVFRGHFCVMEQIPVTYIGKPQYFFKNVISAKTIILY